MSYDINEILEEKKTSYLQNPKLIHSDYNKEEAEIKGYHGRELLELLQNAVDELASTDKKYVCIKFDGNMLIFSNNGNEFSKEGVESLLYANLSPKHNKPNYIGDKGTGFRSILNWSNSIRIYSGSLSIEFSSDNAKELLIELLKSEKVRCYKDEHPELNIATLAAPKIIKPLDKKEYDTVIDLCINNDMVDNVREQITNINSTTILFLDKLERLKIIYNGQKIEYRKHIINGKDEYSNVIIETYENDIKTVSDEWAVANKKGVIDEKNYSIAVAYKPDMTVQPDVLYSFFKTKVEFPVPVLLHGTFELGADRNHLNETKLNKSVLEKLCLLLIEVVQKMYRDNVNYTPLKLLSLRSKFPKELLWSEIEDFYLNNLVQSNIFPSINKEYISFKKNPKFYTSCISNYLYGEKFKNLLIYSDDDTVKEFIIQLAKRNNIILKYNYDYIVNAIDVLLPEIKDRAVLCIKFIEEYEADIKKNKYAPKFILDSTGREVGTEQDIFLPPDNQTNNLPEPPKFANLVYMHKDLLDEFRNVLGTNTTLDALSRKLSPLNVREYSLLEIIRSTITKFNRIEQSEEKISCCIELINWLWEAYKNSYLENINLYSADFKIPMISRNGKINNTDTLYYGKEYGNNTTENLFLNRDDLFVISSDTFNLNNDNIQKFCEFLNKINVGKYPRILHERFTPSSDYINQLISDFNYPLIAGDNTIYNIEEARKANINQVSIDKIENYDIILNDSHTEYILEWLNVDLRARELVTAKFETNKNSFGLLTLGQQYSGRMISGDKISCFMRFEFSRIPWIEVDNERFPPNHCLLHGKYGKRLLPFLIEPDFEIYVKNSNKPLTDTSEIKMLLAKIGSIETLGNIDSHTLYGILLRLPEIDHKGEISRSLYTSVITSKGSISIDKKDNNFIDFMSNGKVFCKNKRYETISNVYYHSEKTVSDIVLKDFNLIAIPNRQNKNNILEYFGVKLLELKSKIIGEPQLHQSNSEFENDFENFKIYAYCYRFGVAQQSETTLIKGLKTKFCKKIVVDYEHKNVPLNDYAFIRGDNSYVYVKVPDGINSVESARIDLEFCATMAEIITSTMDIQSENLFSNLRSLYGQTETGRENLIRQDFDDLSILNDVRLVFGNTQSYRDMFISTCKKIGDSSKLPQINELSEKIDFDNIYKASNNKFILEIMNILDVDIPEFNNHSEFNFDQRPIYMTAFRRLTEEHGQSYKNKLFASLIESTIEEQKQFIDLCDSFNNFEYKPENSKNYNVNKMFFDQWHILKNQKEWDADAQWIKNKKAFLVEKNDVIVNDLLSEKESDSLLYFGKLDILMDLYSKKVDIWKKQEETENNIKNKDDVPLVPVEVIAADSLSPNNYTAIETSRKTGSRSVGMQREYDKSLWGAYAEEIVYKMFQQNFTDVKWVSENAKKKGANPDGIGGLGYDLIYRNEIGETKYVEIKSTTKNDIKFIMTPKELLVAEEKQDKYEIALVNNINDKNTMVIKILQNIFVYGSDENRYKNNKFTLSADNYIISCVQNDKN